MKELEDRARIQPVRRAESGPRRSWTDYPDLRSSVNDVSAVPGGPPAADLPGQPGRPRAWTSLAAYSGNRLVAGLRAAGGLTDLDTTLALRKPEVQVIVDREAANDLGLPVGTVVADTLRILVGGMPVSNFKDRGEQYDVWLRARPADRSSTERASTT